MWLAPKTKQTSCPDRGFSKEKYFEICGSIFLCACFVPWTKIALFGFILSRPRNGRHVYAYLQDEDAAEFCTADETGVSTVLLTLFSSNSNCMVLFFRIVF